MRQRNLNKGVQRDQIIISTKVCGFSDQITWARKSGSGTRITKDQITEAVDGQLERLGVDCIDLLQLHWPDRYIPLYGAPEYLYEQERTDATPIAEQIQIVSELIKSGKVSTSSVSSLKESYGVELSFL